MSEIEPSFRLISDYIGAGEYVISREGVIVGTDYGAQALPFKPSSEKEWKAELGSRCIGLLERTSDLVVASCHGGLFTLARDDGKVVEEKIFAEEMIFDAVPFDGGVLVATRCSLQFFADWNRSGWTFDFHEALGQSVDSVRIVNLFTIEGHVVVGAVDSDKGIGRIIVLDKDGKSMWTSEPGPLTELFKAGNAVFVWCLTGYGKFETHMTRLDGHEIWEQDFAGVGSVLSDGSLAMVIGSNETPEWDHWEYRRVSANGKVEVTAESSGRCATRPLCLEDDTVYFVCSIIYLDPTSSRVDYTNFLAMPQQVLFQHLMGIRPQIPEYDVYLHRMKPGATELELLFEISGSFSLAAPRFLKGYVLLCDGPDLVGVKVD